jgi:hypothetical protein
LHTPGINSFDTTCRYEKYDAPLGGKKGKADDPFQEEYEEIEAQIEQLMKVSFMTAWMML